MEPAAFIAGAGAAVALAHPHRATRGHCLPGFAQPVGCAGPDHAAGPAAARRTPDSPGVGRSRSVAAGVSQLATATPTSLVGTETFVLALRPSRPMVPQPHRRLSGGASLLGLSQRAGTDSLSG